MDPWKRIAYSTLIQIRLSPEQHQRVLRMAKHRGCPVAEIVRSALAHYERSSPDVKSMNGDASAPRLDRSRPKDEPVAAEHG